MYALACEAPLPMPVAWEERAACKGLMPSDQTRLFIPADARKQPAEDVREAKRICYRCVVRSQCLERAIALREKGVWGGTTAAERRMIIRSRAISMKVANVVAGHG